MKVLQFGRYYPPVNGGIETVISSISRALAKRKIVCDVLCSNTSFQYQEENHVGFKVYRTKSLGQLFSVSITPQFVSKLAKIKDNYDIIHVHHPDPMAVLALFIVRPKAKIIVHWHSDIVKQKVALFFYRPIQNWLLRKSNFIIGTSPEYIKGSMHLSKFLNKTISIPIGIEEIPQNSIAAVSKQRLRHNGKFIIFAVGRLVYYKGFEYLIKSAKHLGDDFVILIGGTGPLEKKFKEMLDENRLGQKVKLLGRLSNEELILNYQACDVFCLPSNVKTEAFGIVMIEAMSFGKPIVSTRIPGSGVHWVNQHNVTGFTVSPNNELELAEAFMRIERDPILKKMLSENSRKRFENNFTIDKMADSIEGLYKEVLS